MYGRLILTGFAFFERMSDHDTALIEHGTWARMPGGKALLAERRAEAELAAIEARQSDEMADCFAGEPQHPYAFAGAMRTGDPIHSWISGFSPARLVGFLVHRVIELAPGEFAAMDL